MTIAMRAAAAMAAAASGGPRSLRAGLFSTLSSTPSFFPSSTANQPEKPPAADPNPNLFVSGLSKRTTTDGLREAFSKFGEVVSAKVVTDRVNGYSKGFGFVKYATIEEANEAIKGMHGNFLDGWVIFAEYAKPRPPPPQFGNNQGAPPFGGPQYGQYGR